MSQVQLQAETQYKISHIKYISSKSQYMLITINDQENLDRQHLVHSITQLKYLHIGITYEPLPGASMAKYRIMKVFVKR